MTNKTNIEINVDLLREKSIFIATPMYGGQCSGFYTKSIIDLIVMLNNYGIKNNFFALFNESLITRARNYCADEFIRSDYSHLLFIDSDIEFDPMDVLAMMQLSAQDNMRIIGGPYPKKSISWEKVKKAVDKGFADENPFVLDNYTGDFVFNPVEKGSFNINEPVKVLEIGTGFMLINRDVFLKWDEAKPEYQYHPDHVRTKHFDGERKIMAYFQDPFVNGRHLSEDYFFCQESRALGVDIWICPWMKVHHIGMMKFVGNLAAVAATGSSPTADINELKGLKK